MLDNVSVGHAKVISSGWTNGAGSLLPPTASVSYSTRRGSVRWVITYLTPTKSKYRLLCQNSSIAGNCTFRPAEMVPANQIGDVPRSRYCSRKAAALGGRRGSRTLRLVIANGTAKFGGSTPSKE